MHNHGFHSEFSSGSFNSHYFKNKVTKKNRKVFIIVGIILLVIGIGLTGAAIADFALCFSSNGDFPFLFFLAFIGMPLMGLGSSLLMAGCAFKAMDEVKNSSDPNNINNENYSSEVSSVGGYSDDKMACPNCGTLNPRSATYCKACGKPLTAKKQKTCPNCGEKNDPDALFCKSCGNKLI